jgi:hypothetical protein
MIVDDGRLRLIIFISHQKIEMDSARAHPLISLTIPEAEESRVESRRPRRVLRNNHSLKTNGVDHKRIKGEGPLE